MYCLYSEDTRPVRGAMQSLVLSKKKKKKLAIFCIIFNMQKSQLFSYVGYYQRFCSIFISDDRKSALIRLFVDFNFALVHCLFFVTDS